MTDDLAALAAFTAARLDEDEAAARKLADMLASAPGADLAVCFDDGTSGNAFDYNPWDRIADYDPARVLREVAAKRAILAEHYILFRHDTNEAYEEFSVVSIGGANQDHGCVTCHYYGQGGVKGFGYCRTVRHLAAVWSGHPDYDERWKP